MVEKFEEIELRRRGLGVGVGSVILFLLKLIFSLKDLDGQCKINTK